MRGVQVSELNLNTTGGITVKGLATIFEDGEVIGESYLASSLRKAVEARGPIPIDRILRLYNSGYYGASLVTIEDSRIDKGRVYLKEGQHAPKGMRMLEGPRGGRYYETRAGRGRPFKKPPATYRPEVGERVRLRMAGSPLNGMLARVKQLLGAKNRGMMVEVLSPGGLRELQMVIPGNAIPAPYTAEEKREMKAKDILAQEFGKTDHLLTDYDPLTQLRYDIYTTEAGPNLLVKAAPAEDKPWEVTKESAVPMKAFMEALPEMTTEALTTMKNEVEEIIFSPVSSPRDRKHSQRIGAKFTARACMQKQGRIMHIFPASLDADKGTLAGILTHEVGHAQDYAREDMVHNYNERLGRFWDAQEDMPADPDRMRKIEEENGIPPHPNDWMQPYANWMTYAMAKEQPDKVLFWPRAPRERKRTGLDYVTIGQSSWNDLKPKERATISREVANSAPVSIYAHTDDREYYAEAYMRYHQGLLPETHTMYEHFKRMPEIKRYTGHVSYEKWEYPEDEE